ncbi:BA14K family protein [Zavarzinia sp. CC-PAN008]|uniref:BA14K family protein n=1 Tax=Zavarzinia sp. CC-PAN008 TaxID=3243332 RepID=UPI003F74710B
MPAFAEGGDRRQTGPGAHNRYMDPTIGSRVPPPPAWSHRGRPGHGPAHARGPHQDRYRYVEDYYRRHPHDDGYRRWHRNGNRWSDNDYQRWYRERHDDDNNDAAIAALFGLAAGALLGGALSQPAAPAQPAYSGGGYAPGSQEWYQYCSQRYRSFDPNSGTFVGYDGVRRPCR